MAVHLLLLLFGEKYNWWNYPIVGGSFTDLFDVFGLLDGENNTIINVTIKILTIAPVIAMTTTLFLTGLNKISTKTSHIIVAICFGIPSLCTIINIADTLISHELAAYDAYISIIPLTAFLIMLFLCITMLTKIKINRTLNKILSIAPSVIYLYYDILIMLEDYNEYREYYGYTDSMFDWYGLSELIKAIVMIAFLLFMGLYFIKAYNISKKHEIASEKQSYL